MNADLNGLDEIDLRRQITTALNDLLDDLDDRQSTWRCDGTEPCCEHPTAVDSVDRARRLLADLNQTTRQARQAIHEDPDRARSLLADHADVIDDIEDELTHLDLDTCEHRCPTIPRTGGDTVNLAWDLLDDLTGAGFHVTRTRKEWVA